MNEHDKMMAAKTAVENPAVMAILDDLERANVNKVINADPGNDEARAVYSAETRAIRKLRSRLKSLANQADEEIRKEDRAQAET